MALRLTGTTIPDPSADVADVADVADDRDLVAELDARARQALAAGDIHGYLGCLAQCSEAADPQRRYQAEVRLLEHGFAHAGGCTEAAAVRIYAGVARAALDVLARQPSEPLVLNYAAVACYELWALDAARTLFGAAQRLDPTLPNVERNIAETARRARGPRPRRPVHGSVPGLARRAKQLAGQAGPARGLTISLCMIVRDEQEMLGRCLRAAAPAVDEIVIVDTGSVDATVEIARSFGARVIERPWTGSFAEARNASFDAATGDWLLYLDADEVLVADDVARLRELAGRSWREAFSFIETSFTGELGDGAALVNTALRMMRNRPEYRFEGRIHEQILPTLPSWAPGRVQATSIRIEHYGYLGDVRAAKEKSARNIALLREQQRAESSPSAFVAFNLGCEHAAAGDGDAAVQELARAWHLLGDEATRRRTEYAPALSATRARTLALGGRPADALACAQEGLALFADFTDLVLTQASASLALGQTSAAVALYERCLELGDAPARYGGIAGAGTVLPRLALAGLALGRGAFAEAVAVLEPCLTDHPEFAAVAGPWATARLGQGTPAPDVVSELESRLTTLTPAARQALARALAAAGATELASGQLQRALDDAPASGAPAIRVALAELRLGRGEWSHAAAVAAEVPDDDPHAALACRIETCAAVAEKNLSGARTALARADRVGLPDAERELLTAWIDLAAGGTARDGLPVAAVPLLATLAELLLGAGEPARFGELRELLLRSRLPAREQAELIAEIHRRHGDLAAAATEWLAVCAESPDARARLGLARIAAAHGMTEDAAVFASAALELDPDCAPARELLAALDG